MQSSDAAVECAQDNYGTKPDSRQLSGKIRAAGEEIRFRSLLAQGDDEAALQQAQQVAVLVPDNNTGTYKHRR